MPSTVVGSSSLRECVSWSSRVSRGNVRIRETCSARSSSRTQSSVSAGGLVKLVRVASHGRGGESLIGIVGASKSSRSIDVGERWRGRLGGDLDTVLRPGMLERRRRAR